MSRKSGYSEEYEILPNGKRSVLPTTYIFADEAGDVVRPLPHTVHAGSEVLLSKMAILAGGHKIVADIASDSIPDTKG